MADAGPTDRSAQDQAKDYTYRNGGKDARQTINHDSNRERDAKVRVSLFDRCNAEASKSQTPQMIYVYARECAVASSGRSGRQPAELIRVVPSSALAKWGPVGYPSGLDGSFGETGRRQPYGGGG